MYANQQSAAVPRTTGPAFDQLVDLLPAAKIEIANTKVGPIGDCQSLAQRRQELLVDIVEDARHLPSRPLTAKGFPRMPDADGRGSRQITRLGGERLSENS
ncbi:MAG: hypothetical protein B7Z73_05245, partial [Planctomycetia bacterium 21-64-5]